MLEFQSCQELEVYEVLSAEFTAAYSMKNITYANFTKGPLEKRKELSRSGTPQDPAGVANVLDTPLSTERLLG